MGWTQPICVACWNTRHPDRQTDPGVVYDQGEVEQCCLCGESTVSGIYFRVNPASVRYPQEV